MARSDKIRLMKKILILTSIWGHESIARGVFDALKESDYETHLEIIRIDPFSEKSYKAVYRVGPKLFKIAFKLATYEIPVKVVGKYFKQSYFKLIENMVKTEKPDIVISSYFAFNSSLETLEKKFKFKYINVIPDPWSVTRLHFSPKALNLIFDKHSINRALKYVRRENLAETGWFVEDRFNTKLTKADVRKNLGLDPKVLTLCVTGGSEGTYDILKIINSFVNTKKHIQILFMCGKNNQIYDLARGFAKVLGKRSRVRIFPHKYTSRMNLYIRSSDLVIGKAGPNTIFESVASGVPFFAVSHISGQEDGNLELIKKYNIGYAEENPLKIAGVLKTVIARPEVLRKFASPIKKLADYNSASRAKLLELLS